MKNDEGVFEHDHIQTNKEDPGPALNWDYEIDHAAMIRHRDISPKADTESRGRVQ